MKLVEHPVKSTYTNRCVNNQNTYTRDRELLTAMTEEKMLGEVAEVFH